MSYVEGLTWDSSFFGFAIGKVRDSIRASELGLAVQEADERHFRCTYLLVAAEDHKLLYAAQKHGFVVRDIRVELNRPVAGHPTADKGLRSGQLEDLPSIREIARDRFRETRFFADDGFPIDRSAELYVEWVRKGLKQEHGWTALVTDDLCGFVVCHLDRPLGVGTISLIGVLQSAAGKGVGSTLIAGAGKLFWDDSLVTAHVVTQGNNIPAQRLYQRYGYRTAKTRVWLHRWQPRD